jgi:iron complex outermembrane receptor protein
LPSIPQHRFKAAAEYSILPQWKVGANLIAFSGQYLAGDASNQNPKLPPYWALNLHTTYQISKNFEAFTLVQNLFDTRYYTFGTFFDKSEVPFLNLTDPRTLSPGAPFAVYVGLRVKL